LQSDTQSLYSHQDGQDGDGIISDFFFTAEYAIATTVSSGNMMTTKMKACLMAVCYGAATTSAFSPAVSSNRIPTQLLSEPLSRRGWFQTGAAAVTIATLGSSSPAWAAGGPPTQAELQRIQAGYKGIVYLLDNWDKETTTCRVSSPKKFIIDRAWHSRLERKRYHLAFR
jgi:hypothetical protein